MLIATWVLALSTLALAIEGGTALRGWLAHLQVGKRRRELDEIRRQITLLQHAIWLDVTTAGQGQRPDIDKRVQTMLQIDGWSPDMALQEQAGYFNFGRIVH